MAGTTDVDQRWLPSAFRGSYRQGKHAAYKPKDSQDKSGKDGRDSTPKDKVSRAPVAPTPDQALMP